jgi:hypothetical protein
VQFSNPFSTMNNRLWILGILCLSITSKTMDDTNYNLTVSKYCWQDYNLTNVYKRFCFQIVFLTYVCMHVCVHILSYEKDKVCIHVSTSCIAYISVHLGSHLWNRTVEFGTSQISFLYLFLIYVIVTSSDVIVLNTKTSVELELWVVSRVATFFLVKHTKTGKIYRMTTKYTIKYIKW